MLFSFTFSNKGDCSTNQVKDRLSCYKGDVLDHTNQLSVKHELTNFDGSQKDITVLQKLNKEKVINEVLDQNNQYYATLH